jgi:signal recognition particle subunit SRP54
MKFLPDQLTGGLGMPQLTDEQSAMMEREMKRTEAISDSMTRQERQDHKLINASRRTRIAKGAGATIAEVNALLKQYGEMRQMMRAMSGMGLFGGGGAGMLGGGMGKMMKKMGGLLGGGGMPSMPGMPPTDRAPGNAPSRKKTGKKKRWKR